MRNHIHFPAARRVPVDTLRELRQVDPRAELLHIEGTRWMLGAVHPGDRALLHQGALQIRSTTRWLTRAILNKVRLGRALLQGFKPIAEYQVATEMDFARIVQDFRERDWRYRHVLEEERDREEEETDIEHERAAAYRTSFANFEARAREAHGYVFRGARHFRQPAKSWGRRSPTAVAA
jgi:hypothetical protein